MSGFKEASAVGTLTAMLESFDEHVAKQRNDDGAERLRSLTDFNGGAIAAVAVIRRQYENGADIGQVLQRLEEEGIAIHEGLNPDNFVRRSS